MSAIQKYEPQNSLSEIMTLGDAFAKSGYFKDASDASKAVVKVLYGKELGIAPVTAMLSIHIIEGKPALSANLLGAMVKRSEKYNYNVLTMTDAECVIEFTENGKPSGKSTFSMKDAERAGLASRGVWKSYPRSMMFARALSQGIRMYAPDLSTAPIYVPEELGAEVNEEGTVISHPVAAPKLVEAPRTFGTPKPTTFVAHESQALADFIAAPAPIVIEAGAATVVFTATDEEFIDAGQQTNFAIEFKKALLGSKRLDAERLRHEWLASERYLDTDGNPTSRAILKSEFIAARDRATAWAKAVQA